MSLLFIDGYKLKEFIISGANKLNEKKELINTLNVFPVPDGDTGTNMSMTISSAAIAVSKINSPNIYEVSKIISTAALRGARGNSGVILSQIFRGFSKALEGKERADAKDFANALNQAMETAYKAVMKPKEGTILTISKALSEKALELSKKTKDIKEMTEQILAYANSALEKTTSMLPELKQAGVVDAGGKGLLTIIEGALFGKPSETFDFREDKAENININNSIPKTDILFGYCTEFFINIEKGQKSISDIEDSLKDYIKNIGDSIVVVGDEDFIKVHLHTDNPGLALERALKIGSLDKIKIENMRIQHTNLIDFSKQSQKTLTNENSLKDFGFVAVSIGSGLNEIFKDLGVDQVIEGGQTMNPSTQDFVNAIEKINAKNVFVLPNNKNIILSAKQAIELCKNKNVVVIESVSIPQGYSALTKFLEHNSLEKNIEDMNSSIKDVVTGQITFAVRDTKIDEFDIKTGDYLAIIDGKISGVEKDLTASSKTLIKKIIETKKDSSLITVFYGEEVKETELKSLSSYLKENFKNLDLEIIKGNQPLYHYIISAE